VTQPNLIANCFARKSIKRQRRIFSSAYFVSWGKRYCGGYFAFSRARLIGFWI